MKTKKKWLKKATAICTAGLLSAAALSSAVYAADSYSSIEKNAWSEKVKDMAGAYATSLEESQSLISGVQGDISLKLEDSGRSLLGFIAPFDVSWMNDITLSTTSTFADGQTGTLMKVLLNDNLVCTLEYYLDPETQDIYMRIPELSDKYLKTNLKEATEQQTATIEEDIENADIPADADSLASAYSESLSLSASLMSDLSASMPEAAVVETLLDKYGSMLFDNLTEVDGSQATLTAGDISQECTVYEGQISAADAIKTGTDILEAAKSDEDIKKLLDSWSEKLSDGENLYDSFTESIDTGLDALKNTDTDDSDESYISTRIWVDENGRIAGREISLHENDTDTPVLTWQMPENGSDFGYLLSFTPDDESDYVLSGSGQIDGDKLNGTYEFSTGGTVLSVIEVKDYDTASIKEGYLNGNYTITFPAGDTEDDSLAMLENFALVLDLSSEKTSGSVALSVESAGSTLGTLSITSGAGETVDIPDLASLKDVCDASNDEDMNDYAATLDFTSIMENLSAAGVPDEVVTYILSGGSSSADTDTYTETDEAADAA